MVHIRQPFFSIATATIFGGLGLIYGIGANDGYPVVLGGAELDSVYGYALSGLLFLMAYFALVHLKLRD